MQTRTPIRIPPSEAPIDHHQKIVSLGSCFADRIGQRLRDHKFNVLVNPFGIGYNAHTLAEQVETALGNTKPDEDLYVERDSLMLHYGYHSDMRAPTTTELEQLLAHTGRTLAEQWQSAGLVIVTLGTSIVYVDHEDRIVANCHKQPASLFRKEMLAIEDTHAALERLYKMMPAQCRMILTVSPVRHIKEGLSNNQRSKARLIEAAQRLAADCDRASYFPAYEVMMDDLRDYRYYERDRIHPTAEAADYIWDLWRATHVSEGSQALCEQIGRLRAAMAHRPFAPQSPGHRSFCAGQLAQAEALARANPHLDWTAELQHFKKHQT